MSSEARVARGPVGTGLVAMALLLGGGPAGAGDSMVDPVGPIFVPAPAALSAGAGAGPGGAAAVLRGAAAFCGALQPAYQVSCLGDRIAAAAAALPRGPETAEARKALEAAAARLDRLAREARDPDMPQITARSTGPQPQRTQGPLVPVAPARQADIRAEALEVVAEAQTVLLRSTSRSAERQAQFVEIAQALESGKVLLRS
ncbi:hypothetical protein [Mangrovicoccus algicola]|uniref:Uncharacterized protein n=1 Tax=Mangrovicoccus algicola TaxID=2771008 RepID=A0A8J6YW27_9RHOB|nr:hypothetical protein [Mangrovicoccus algicola]MBE3637279.1 hypothetical protein [Mangrovicoccus algicola]